MIYDNLGGLLSALLVGAVILAINFAAVPNAGTLVLSLAIIGGAALIAFVIRQRRADRPAMRNHDHVTAGMGLRKPVEHGPDAVAHLRADGAGQGGLRPWLTERLEHLGIGGREPLRQDTVGDHCGHVDVGGGAQVALVVLEDRVAEVVVADIEAGPWPWPQRRFDAVLVTNYLWRPLWPCSPRPVPSRPAPSRCRCCSSTSWGSRA